MGLPRSLPGVDQASPSPTVRRGSSSVEPLMPAGSPGLDVTGRAERKVLWGVWGRGRHGRRSVRRRSFETSFRRRTAGSSGLRPTGRLARSRSKGFLNLMTLTNRKSTTGIAPRVCGRGRRVSNPTVEGTSSVASSSAGSACGVRAGEAAVDLASPLRLRCTGTIQTATLGRSALLAGESGGR